MGPIIYLDNSATTAVLPEVVKAMTKMLEINYGNPSSLHGLGLKAEKALNEARYQVAKLIDADTSEIYFTSGGTEANNWVLYGLTKARQRQGKHIITTSIEHSSVLAACKRLETEGFEVTYLPVNSDGVISLKDVESSLRKETILVSIMSVNNEMGSQQPIAEIADLVHKKSKAVLHVDHVQGYGKIPLNCHRENIDLMSISSHKIHGPKGTGALYVRKGLHIEPFMVGGNQENGKRSGTENTAGIVGFGVAAKLAGNNFEERVAKMREFKVTLAHQLINDIPNTYINGPEPEKGAPHILSVSFPGIRAEILIHMLEQKGVYVSTGSACHSRFEGASHVLKALKLSPEHLEGTIRISLGALNTQEQIEPTVAALKECVSELRAL
ncbi:MAG: cysteine desulfurase [Clostridia bacterium]|nr:cysteine desulfurase [Clostridia bacterium]